MAIQQIRKSILHWCFSFAVVCLLLLPSSVFATHSELSRLASQIELLSSQIAFDLPYIRNYGSVRQRAVTLSREAAQLADVLRRKRSNSRVRSQFKDVQRGYERLEQAFSYANRRDHESAVYRNVGQLSDLFTELGNEYYYGGYGQYAGYGLQNYGSPYAGSRYSVSPRYGSQSYSSGVVVRQRERAIPPVFRGSNVNRHEGRRNDRQGRLDHDSRTGQQSSSFDHGSRVLDRQSRQNTEQRELDNQARDNHSATQDRQPPANSRRGQRVSNEERQRIDIR